MHSHIKLKTEGHAVPHEGETLGQVLVEAADALAATPRDETITPRRYWAPRVGLLYGLAAQAYDIASGATIGHKRGERYTARAAALREKAALFAAEAEAA